MSSDSDNPAPLLRMRGVNKQFPGVRALQDVDLDLYPGEVLALMGENGAGKSTLMRVLGGSTLADSASIEIGGRPTLIASPADSQRHGVGVIYQEFNLAPEMSVRENVFLGQEQGWLRPDQERRKSRALFDQIQTHIEPDQLVKELSVAEQQAVEIAKVLAMDAQIIVMDEPSAALSPREVEGLFQTVRGLTAQGIGIIYISHRMSEIFEIADRVMVMRDGRHVSTNSIQDVTREQIIEAMVGRTLDQEFPKRPTTVGETQLAVRGLTRGDAVRDVSFEVRAGEVLALTGLMGAGRTETARLIFGADHMDSGQIERDGKVVPIRSPRDAIAEGICLLTEDRKNQGLVLPLSCQENFALPNMSRFAARGVLNNRAERESFEQYIEMLKIRLASPDQPAETLSGGNQQKLVLAKWLQHDARVLIFDEPTRGIDVGAKYEIYLLMNRLCEQGKAIIMISSELQEVIGMADRIIVMHEGRVTGEIEDAANATQQQIMDLAVI